MRLKQMKFKLFAVTIPLAFAAATALVLAQEQTAAPTSNDAPAAINAPATAPATVPATQSATTFNKKCPISGDAVDPKGQTFTYKGKKIGFCCDDCIEAFKKNPEKYMKGLK